MKAKDEHFKIAARQLVARGEFKSEENALKSLRHLWAMVDAMEYADDEQEIRERYTGKEVVLMQDYTVPAGRPGIVAPVLKKGTRWVVVGAEGPNAIVSESHRGQYDPRNGLYSVDAGQLDLTSGYSAEELADMANGGGLYRGEEAAPRVADRLTLEGAPVQIHLTPHHEATTHVVGEMAITTVRPTEVPAVLFDTHAVWKRCNVRKEGERPRDDVPPDAVARVLDAVVALIREGAA